MSSLTELTDVVKKALQRVYELTNNINKLKNQN